MDDISVDGFSPAFRGRLEAAMGTSGVGADLDAPHTGC